MLLTGITGACIYFAITAASFSSTDFNETLALKPQSELALKPQSELALKLQSDLQDFTFYNVSTENIRENSRSENDSVEENEFTAIPIGIGDSSDEAVQQRLPDHLIPILYQLSLKIFLPNPWLEFSAEKNSTFEGEVTIFLECKKATKFIILNAFHLKIRAVEVFQVNGGNEPGNTAVIALQLAPKSFKLIPEKHQLIIFLAADLIPSHQYLVSIQYKGNFSQNQRGLYLVNYKEGGEDRYLCVTHFEPFDARRAIPCLDEPIFKAAWEIAIIHPEGTIATSNAEIKSTNSFSEGWLQTLFDKTPRMSSYIVAFAVHSFNLTKSTTTRGKPIRSWTQPSLTSFAQFSNNFAAELMDFYENYLGIDYPLPKLDQLALPESQSAAMENWGLITYKDESIIWIPTRHTFPMKTEVAGIIAHELAHQWFGNLVTMKWWDDLWLNEGFSTFLENVAVDSLTEKKWHTQEKSLFALQQTMQRDQQINHELKVHLSENTIGFSSASLGKMFDRMVYDKGAALLYMLNQTIGEEAFLRGVHDFLLKHQFANADRQDFFDSIHWSVLQSPPEMQPPMNVSNFMQTWLMQSGYPVVTVRRLTSSVFSLQQHKFVNYGLSVDDKSFCNPETANFTDFWHIPVFYRFLDHQYNEPFMVWMQPGVGAQIQIPWNSSIVDNWLLINPDVRGFFRVNYDEANWELLAIQLQTNHKIFSSRTRSQLIDDSFNLASSGCISFAIPFSLTLHMGSDENFLVWQTMISNMEEIFAYFQMQSNFAFIEEYMQKLLIPLYKRYGWKSAAFRSDDLFEFKLAKLISTESCRFRVEECKKDSNDLFQNYIVGCLNENSTFPCEKSNISLDILPALFCFGIMNNDESVYDRVKKRLQYSNDSLEKYRIIIPALTCNPRRELLESAFLLLLNEPDLDFSESINGILENMKMNPLIGLHLWNFMKFHTEQFINHALKRGRLYDVISAVIDRFTRQHQIDEFDQWLRYWDPDDNFYLSTRANLRNCTLNWWHSHAERLMEWFQHHDSQN